MFSYVFMKLLETRPRSYDRRMDRFSGGRVARIKQSVADAVPEGAHVLEIGCGTGELAAMLAEKDATVDGFDASPAMIEVARERIETEALDDRITVREMGVEGMDELDDESYGVVTSTLVFSELSPDERRFATKHAFRVLEPGGRLVVAAEVRPRSAGRRLVQSLVRAPAAAAAYLVSSSSTRPVPDLSIEVAGAGFVIESEERSHGDSIVILVAHRPLEGDRR